MTEQAKTIELNGSSTATSLEESASQASNQVSTYAETLKLNAERVRDHHKRVAAAVEGQADAARVLVEEAAAAERVFVSAIRQAEETYYKRLDDLATLFRDERPPLPQHLLQVIEDAIGGEQKQAAE